MKVSGREIRHHFYTSKIFKEAKVDNLANLKNWVSYSKFSQEQKYLLAKLIVCLTVALRSRYSGLEGDSDRKYFNTTPENSKYGFEITSENIATFLKANFFQTGDYDQYFEKLSLQLLEICTHRHTTLSPVLKYTATGEELLKLLVNDKQRKKDLKIFMKDVKVYLESHFTKSNFLKEEDKMSLRGIFFPPMGGPVPIYPFYFPDQQQEVSKQSDHKSSKNLRKDFDNKNNQQFKSSNPNSLTTKFDTSVIKEHEVLIPRVPFLKETPVDEKKRQHFLKFIHLAQNCSSNLSINEKAFFCCYFSISKDDIDLILNYTQRKSSISSYFFTTFLTDNIRILLRNLKYSQSEIEEINIYKPIKPENVIKDIVETLFERKTTLDNLPIASLNLSLVDFKKAQGLELNLSGAILNITQLPDLCLDRVILEKVYFDLGGPIADELWLPILTSIKNIPDQYANLKMNLMVRICTRIENDPKQSKVLSIVQFFLLSSLFEGDFYTENKTILLFLESILIPSYIENSNGVGKIYSKEEIENLWEKFIFPIIIKYPNQWFMETFSGFVNQFICSCLTGDDEKIKSYGLTLQEQYLNFIPQNALMSFQSLVGMDIIPTGPKANYMIYLCPGDNFVALPFNYYKRFVLHLPVDGVMAWTSFCCCKKTDENGEYAVVPQDFDVIQSIPLFFSEYKKAVDEKEKLIKLFEQFNFGPYLSHILKAMNFSFHNGKDYKGLTTYTGDNLMNSMQAQVDLRNILQQFFHIDEERFRAHLIKISGYPNITFDEDSIRYMAYSKDDVNKPRNNRHEVEEYHRKREENWRIEKEIREKFEKYDPGFLHMFYRCLGAPPNPKNPYRYMSTQDRYLICLTPKAEALIDSIFLWKERGEEHKRTPFLLCLSGIFLMLSSKCFFGIEEDSIEAFRSMAMACLVTVIYSRPLNDHEKRFLEYIQGKTWCGRKTAAGFFLYLRSRFPTEFFEFIPPAWQAEANFDISFYGDIYSGT